MPESAQCSACGAKLASASAEGLCPACLLKSALPSDPYEAPTLTAPESARLTEPRVGSRLTPGQSFGPYRIERLLGKGGMGEVYEAEELDSGRRVALKLLTHGLDDQNRARFLREGRLAASISHPNTVYVFGTDEIDGIPVIAMELAPGGTLKDRVKADGPLPPTEAVDVILQVIAGLEAAASAGVLHRDIKPSNCFVDSDGRVKIGDFGLSISTLAREDTRTQITTTGTARGTPAFASPEQLRGEPVDVRSDIYSVGTTLYYLLTGAVPFDAPNLVQLVTQVVQVPPPSPRKSRPDVPKGLAAVVLRCLAKDRKDRFLGYPAVTRALQPFVRPVPTPAPLGLRLLAGTIDQLGLRFLLPVQRITAYLPQFGTYLPQFGVVTADTLLSVAYFALLEGWWAASLGKFACGIRVTGVDGQRPGVVRATVRAGLFVVGFELAVRLFLRVASVLGIGNRFLISGGTTLDFFTALGLFLYIAIAPGTLLFVTARRRNRLAAIHDWLSGTRVALKPAGEVRPMRYGAAEATISSTGMGRLGPFLLLEDPDRTQAGQVVAAYDERLRRRVWMHVLPLGSPPVTPQRRDLNRRGRLHWLAGRRTAEECWDAYEGLDGQPVVALLNHRQPWHTVRHWLLELAQELTHGLADRSLPPLALDRLFITADGHPKLLDWPAPNLRPSAEASSVSGEAPASFPHAQRFLYQIAFSALEGRTVGPAEATASLPTGLLPVRARSLLDQLRSQAIHAPQAVVSTLESLVRHTTSLSRWKRCTHLAICGFVPVSFVIVGLVVGALHARWETRHPDLADLDYCLDRLIGLEGGWLEDGGDDTLSERRALEVYVADRFRDTISDPSTWSGRPSLASIVLAYRETAETVLANVSPNLSSEERSRAAGLVQANIETERASRTARNTPGAILQSEIRSSDFAFRGAALIGLLSAAAVPGGLLLYGLGIGVVTRHGTPVSRRRGFCRALAGWSVVLVSAYPSVFSLSGPVLVALTFSLVPLAILPIALTPHRGLQDLITGTYLVPR